MATTTITTTATTRATGRSRKRRAAIKRPEVLPRRVEAGEEPEAMETTAGINPEHSLDQPQPLPRDPVVEINAGRGWLALNLKEVWSYRELLYFLTWRDVKVRYKQTVLGVAWVVLQPLMTMLIFAVVFTRFVRADAGDIP